MTKIAIVDDDPVLLARLSNLINMQEQWKCTLQAHSLGELFEKTDIESEPDVLLLDIQLKDINSLQHLDKIKKVLPRTRILIMTGHTLDKYVLDALTKGADGYITKGGKPAEIISAIRNTIEAGAYLGSSAAKAVVSHLRQAQPAGMLKEMAACSELLSPRELAVAQLLIDGMSYKVIAGHFFISINTVRQHVKNIYRKLEVKSRMELHKKLNNA